MASSECSVTSFGLVHPLQGFGGTLSEDWLPFLAWAFRLVFLSISPCLRFMFVSPSRPISLCTIFPALGLLRHRGLLGFISLSQGLLLSRVGSSLCFCVSGRSHQSCDHGLDLQPSFAAFYLCLIFFFVELQLFGPFVVHSYLW